MRERIQCQYVTAYDGKQCTNEGHYNRRDGPLYCAYHFDITTPTLDGVGDDAWPS